MWKMLTMPFLYFSHVVTGANRRFDIERITGHRSHGLTFGSTNRIVEATFRYPLDPTVHRWCFHPFVDYWRRRKKPVVEQDILLFSSRYWSSYFKCLMSNNQSGNKSTNWLFNMKKTSSLCPSLGWIGQCEHSLMNEPSMRWNKQP